MSGHRVAVLTASDSVSEGTREDKSGDKIQEILGGAGFDIALRAALPDDKDSITSWLKATADAGEVNLIVTTGGTGLGPRDVTPDCTRDVMDYEVPGVAEAMRMETLRKTPMAMASRQVCGVRRQTLIVNLPGSPKAVEECLTVILPALPHMLEILRGNTRHD